MSAGAKIAQAYAFMAGILGSLCLILEARRGIRSEDMHEYADRLRAAADILDSVGGPRE